MKMQKQLLKISFNKPIRTKTFLLLMLGFISAFASQAQMITPSKFWQDKERELRYLPEGEEFVIRNGKKRFTRAIYGTNTGFRFETSDFPELGLYMPNLGGTVYMAISTPSTTVWIHQLESIESRFKSGQRTYVIRDRKILQKGLLKMDVVALADRDGLVAKLEAKDIPPGVKILWIYGGANNKRFSREGDLGADPADCFYIKPENCEGNLFDIKTNQFTIRYGHSTKQISDTEAYENSTSKKPVKENPSISLNAKSISGTFPIGTLIKQADGNQINSLQNLIKSPGSRRPVLVAEYQLSSTPFYFTLHSSKGQPAYIYPNLAKAFNAGVDFRTRIASTISIKTPDPFINTLGGIFSGVADACWEAPGFLHGAIGWRVPLTGWRAAYLGDLLGLQDKARMHFDGYLNSQVTNIPVTLPPAQDTALHLARAAKIWGTPMYSNGYICRNPNKNNVMHHYDMNLVFVDELLWHLNWTGDMDYARKVFPALQRHLAWEKNTYDPDNDGLYDAYCCIWASDALQYNGGKVTHSSAYNYRANKMAAEIAQKLGLDAALYKEEAERILSALDKELWIKDKGWWAEFKDNMGHKMRHDNAALWSIYHAIDSDIHDIFKAYQSTRYIDTEIPHIPVLAKGLTDTANYMVSTTNWQPYDWSINNVAFAEVAHTALAYWQAGRPDEAFKLFKGTILDAMYLGSGPGNITQISFYDAARGETYRDFADPAAMGARAMVQGMYGIIPDLMNEKLTIRPGFPQAWDYAEIKTKNIAYTFKRDGHTDHYTVTPNLLKKNVQLIMELIAPRNKVKSIKVNGKETNYAGVDAVAVPKIRLDAGRALQYDIVVEWEGDAIAATTPSTVISNGADLKLKLPFPSGEIYDPQSLVTNGVFKGGVLTGKISAQVGHRTLFFKVVSGDMKYWLPVHIKVVKPVELICNAESTSLDFEIVNNQQKPLNGDLFINGKHTGRQISIAANGRSHFSFTSPVASLGTNKVEIRSDNDRVSLNAINWNIVNPSNIQYQPVSIQSYFNDKLRDIFAFDKYLTPRYQYTTLQVPTQGMGQWCHPERLSNIDDNGIRNIAANNNNIFTMPQGVTFATPGEANEKNVLFTSLWDNYPAKVQLPLSGKASKAYFLIAGSTYHMQSHILNGQIRVQYKDGTDAVLDLVLPDNLLPIDQDIFIDKWAFNSPQPRPWRVRLKTGEVSRYHAGELSVRMSNYPMVIDGGMATLLDLPLDQEKDLKSITLETRANEVIIGLMGLTLQRP